MKKLFVLMSLLSLLGCRPNPSTLDSFYYSATHGYRGFTNRGYRAERLNDGKTRITVELGDDRDRVFLAEASVMDSLEALVQQYKMDRYKERYKPMFDIKDGDTWDFSLKYSDGKSVRSGGYEALPANGREAFQQVEAFFSPWLKYEPDEEASIVAFRYELHNEEGTEVFSFRKERNAVYFRNLGSWEGYNYYCGDPEVLTKLDKDLREIHACSYCGEKLSEEDKSRPRWIAILTYSDGRMYELMDYLDRDSDDYKHRPPTNTEQLGEHSRTTYKADGSPSRTINYSGDGTVLGGHDFDNPTVDF